MKLKIPGQLERCIIEDWEHITVLGRLLPLPRTHTVDSVLTTYVEHHRGATTKEAVSSVFKTGLQSFFQRAVATNLLYEEERQQFDQILRQYPNTPLCRIYGPEHLMRLFIKLPSLLAYTTANASDLKALQGRLESFLGWLDRNIALFVADYKTAPRPLPATTSDKPVSSSALSSSSSSSASSFSSVSSSSSSSSGNVTTASEHANDMAESVDGNQSEEQTTDPHGTPVGDKRTRARSRTRTPRTSSTSAKKRRLAKKTG